MLSQSLHATSYSFRGKGLQCTVISPGFLGPKHTSLVLIHYTVPVTRLKLLMLEDDARREDDADPFV